MNSGSNQPANSNFRGSPTNYGESGGTQYNSGQYNGYGGNNYAGSGYSGAGYNNSGYGNSNFGVNTQQNYGQRDFGQGSNENGTAGVNSRSNGWAFGSTGTTPGNNAKPNGYGPNTGSNATVNSNSNLGNSNVGMGGAMSGRDMVGVTRGYQSGTTPSLTGGTTSWPTSVQGQSNPGVTGTTSYQSASPWMGRPTSGYQYRAQYAPNSSSNQQFKGGSNTGVQTQDTFYRGAQPQNSTNAPANNFSPGAFSPLNSSQFNNNPSGLNGQGAPSTTQGDLDDLQND
jgi:hypothetical protein